MDDKPPAKPIPSTARNAWQHLMEPFEGGKRMLAPIRLLTIPSEHRAEILRTRITEVEITKRKRIEEREKSRQAKLNSDGYNVVRALVVALGVVFVIAVSINSCNAVEDWHDIRVKQIAAANPAPVATTPSYSIQVTPTPAASAK